MCMIAIKLEVTPPRMAIHDLDIKLYTRITEYLFKTQKAGKAQECTPTIKIFRWDNLH